MSEHIVYVEPITDLPATLRVPPAVACAEPLPGHFITGLCEVAGYPDAPVSRGVGDSYVCQRLGRCVRTMFGVLPPEK